MQLKIAAKHREMNSRGRGYDFYTMLALPGSGTLVWADQVEGAEVIRDDFPRVPAGSAIRAADRHGERAVQVDVPVGTVKLRIYKPAQGGKSERKAAVLGESGEWVAVPCTAVRRGDGWVTRIGDTEYA